ncbi:porin family protein [Vibrio metschnikovii]|nr:porin family protein [Vibrio metschnikovii]EKO3768208.1 porin family protein [Vibrio metschnikovii]
MKKTLLALALLGASSAAMADALVYAGASVGQSDYRGDSSTAYNLHVGSGILPFFAVEGGYTKLGDFKINGIETSASTMYAALKPSIDFGPLHIYARGGIHSWKTEINNSKDDDGFDIMYGVGAEYFIMGPFSVGAGYHRYTLDKKDVSVLSFNATFHFL